MTYLLLAWLIVLSAVCWRLSKKATVADARIGQIAEHLNEYHGQAL